MIPGGARGSEDNGNTAASRNTAACTAFSLGFRENPHRKTSYSRGKSEDSEKTLEAYDEKS